MNPYPAMREAFTSLSFAVSGPMVGNSAEGGAAFSSYFESNFARPWGDQQATCTLKSGLQECIEIIDKKRQPNPPLSAEVVKQLGVQKEAFKQLLSYCEEEEKSFKV